jgi:hypothetical protein
MIAELCRMSVPGPRALVTRRARALVMRGSVALLALVLVACGAGPRPLPAPPCDQVCQDGVALRGLREAMKFGYNREVATRPVGAQDATTTCYSYDGSQGGSVHIFGAATVNAIQGASIVELNFDFENCHWTVPPDATAAQNYALTLTGTLSEEGTISVQPTATTALSIESGSVSVSGTVYDPPVDYAVSNCTLSLIQSGNAVSGSLCGRRAGFTF